MAEPLFVAELRVRGNVSFGNNEKRIVPTTDGTPAFNFSVCVNHTKLVNASTGEYKADGETWIQVACYGNLAKKAFAMLSKGTLVEVTGPVRTRAYTTQSGATGTAFQITSASSIALSIMGKLESTNAQPEPEMAQDAVAPALDELAV